MPHRSVHVQRQPTAPPAAVTLLVNTSARQAATNAPDRACHLAQRVTSASWEPTPQQRPDEGRDWSCSSACCSARVWALSAMKPVSSSTAPPKASSSTATGSSCFAIGLSVCDVKRLMRGSKKQKPTACSAGERGDEERKAKNPGGRHRTSCERGQELAAFHVITADELQRLYKGGFQNETMLPTASPSQIQPQSLTQMTVSNTVGG
ncbi:hypothetical protein TSOC_012142 [Tetrabaena socialis]|uniref:Uncharacterized protein n=1 Tax=Tetrabaena socialis TaxID=47790 RepID=A0A2J7ZNT8_9CHLO|nr:hypothetical protein TSOC_012142 [Tetrabaena socialis]|eukprot:PNH01927.1 hypothetical protein TSOC_012142 [Tetrabaena socialis]